MRNHFKSVVVSACAIAWLSSTNTVATTVIPPTFEKMADRADLVFVGKALSSRSEWRSVGTNRAMLTLVDFETKEVPKVNAGKSVMLQFLGGTVGDVTTRLLTGIRRNESDSIFNDGLRWNSYREGFFNVSSTKAGFCQKTDWQSLHTV